MSTLTLNLNNVNAISTAMPRLKPWEIHNVVLKDIKLEEFKGKKDVDKTYTVLKFRFENDNGYYEETIFAPKEEDVKRGIKSDGKEMPSNFEQFTFLIAQLGTIIAPENYEKLKGTAFDFSTIEGFKKFGELLIRALTPGINKNYYLKLIGNNKNEARLPYFIALNSKGEAFLASNFLSKTDNLFFSSYELNSKNKRESAKPTEMSIESEVDNSDINFQL